MVLAEDGFDALAKVNDHMPDLIFCDILMPRLDGYQTCAIIKRNERFTAMPVMMLSSKDGVFDKARGPMVGSEDYLTKPFTKEQLLRRWPSTTRPAFHRTVRVPVPQSPAAPCGRQYPGQSATQARFQGHTMPIQQFCWSTIRRPNWLISPTCSPSAASPCARPRTAKTR